MWPILLKGATQIITEFRILISNYINIKQVYVIPDSNGDSV